MTAENTKREAFHRIRFLDTQSSKLQGTNGSLIATFQNEPCGREPRASMCDATRGSFCLFFVVFVGSNNRHAKAFEAYVRKHPGSFPG